MKNQNGGYFVTIAYLETHKESLEKREGKLKLQMSLWQDINALADQKLSIWDKEAIQEKVN